MAEDEPPESVRARARAALPAITCLGFQTDGQTDGADAAARAQQARLAFKGEEFGVEVGAGREGGAPSLRVAVQRLADGAAWHADFSAACASALRCTRATAHCASRACFL
jgi:hypothetical protein